MRGGFQGTRGARAVGAPQGSRAGWAAPSARTAREISSPNQASSAPLGAGQWDSAFTQSLLRGVFCSAEPLPTPSPHSSKAVGLRFKGESRAGNALIPRHGPAEECYRIFPWLFLLKHVYKQQHWVMQLCLSAFSCSRQGAAGVI